MIIDYKSKYFNDRAAITWFTKYMIAIINNCERFEELALEVKQRWWKSSATSATSGSSTTMQMSETMASNFESVLQIFAELRKDSANYLLDEAFMDIDVHFTEISLHICKSEQVIIRYDSLIPRICLLCTVVLY